MRASQLLGLSLLPFVAYAVKKPVGTFEKYHERFLASAPLKLDDASYEALTAAPRDYGVAILLTALEARFGCALCRDFQPEWDVLGKSWAKGDKKGASRMLYGTLDFTDGKATFQKVRCSSLQSTLPLKTDVDLETVDATNCSRFAPLSPDNRPNGEV